MYPRFIYGLLLVVQMIDARCLYSCGDEEKKEPFLTAKQKKSLKDQLKIDEGVKDTIYNDTVGHPTFGIGHKITKNDPEFGKPVGTKVSQKRINKAFETDVLVAEKIVMKIFPNAACFPGEVKEILINMAFNLGEAGLKGFKKFIAAVNKGDWATAADEMKDSQWYKQVKGRAERLEARMRAVTEKIREE